jgi:superfamily II DNA or RNA helicase
MILRFTESAKLIEVVDATQVELDQLAIESQAYIEGFRGSKWVRGDLISHFYDTKFLPAGLWYKMLMLRNSNWTIQITNFESLLYANCPKQDQIDAYVDTLDTPYNLRYYQRNYIHLALKYRRANFVVGTSGGKTFMTYIYFRYLLDHEFGFDAKQKLLMIVPSIKLVTQGHNDFKSYQIDNRIIKTYKIHSGAQNEFTLADSHIIISTYQSLVNMPNDFFDNIIAYFVDEAHGANAISMINIIKQLRNTKWSLGLTGTFPHKNTLARLNIESYIGPLLGSHKVHQMITDNHVADVFIKLIEIHHSNAATAEYMQYLLENPDIVENKTKLLLAEQHHLFSYQPRIDVIAMIAALLDKNTLILARRISEIDVIYDTLCAYVANNNINKTIHRIKGGTPITDRDDICALLDSEPNSHILVASTGTIATGTSVTALFYAILTGIGKPEIGVIQAIGRFLRLHPDKVRAIIIDISDKLHTTCNVLPKSYTSRNYSWRHRLDRIHIYKDNKYPYSDKPQIINI